MSDVHKYIIKMPDLDPPPKYGLGFQFFHNMKLRQNEIAQFIVETDEAVTFGELLDASKRVAINLKKMDLADDAIIAICSWTHKQSCMPYIAGQFNGNILTVLDPYSVPKDKARMFQKVTPSIIFVDEDLLENVEESLRIAELDIQLVVFGANDSKYISFNDLLKAYEEEIKAFEPVKLNNDRTAAIVFSSGTTGVPKGICLSHYALLSQTSGFPLPVTVALSSPNWISYNLMMIRSFREGGPMVLCRKFEFSQVWNLVDKYKIYMLLATTYQCSQIIKESIHSSFDLSSLKYLIISGATLPLEIYLRFKEKLSDLIIVQTYGLSEACGPALTFDLAKTEHQELHKKFPTSIGSPVPGIWYKVVDPETEEILGPNMPGELRIKSKCCMKGYYEQDASQDFDSDGYLKTGDIVIYDENMCFFYVERLKEMVKFRAYMFSPTEMENALITHPSVEIAAVIGVPHVEDTYIPTAVVKFKSNGRATSEELMDYVDKILKDERKRIRSIKILKEFPVSGTGKILKKKLVDMVSAGEI